METKYTGMNQEQLLLEKKEQHTSLEDTGTRKHLL